MHYYDAHEASSPFTHTHAHTHTHMPWRTTFDICAGTTSTPINSNTLRDSVIARHETHQYYGWYPAVHMTCLLIHLPTETNPGWSDTF